MEAWLFDVYAHPHRSGLWVWVKQGDAVTKRYVPYQPTFCVKAETQPLEHIEAILRGDRRVAATWRTRQRLWLRGPEMEVLKVQPRRLQDIWGLATELRRRTHTKGYMFFDVDHSVECRWMHEMGLWSMCRLRVGPDGKPQLRLHPDEDRWTVEYPNPGLRVARLEVEVEQRGAEREVADPLRAIQLGTHRFEVADGCAAGERVAGERAALLSFGAKLRELDPDAIVTRHGDRFDIPYLLRRIRLLGLEGQVNLGRDPDVHPDKPDQQSKSIHTYGRWLFKTHAYYLRGRWHIDLAKKTLDSEDDRKDLHGIVYLARVANRRGQDVNRNGAGFALQQMQIDLATDWGVALPWKRNLAEDWKDAATLCAVDRGGQIMVPQPGIYEDVAACDFSGYYPSLVVTRNLSSDSLNCTCCPDGDVIPELNYHVCRQQGHQSLILKRIWGHRRWAKAVLRRAKLEAETAPEVAKN